LSEYEREGSSFKKTRKISLKEKNFPYYQAVLTPVITNHFWGYEVRSCFFGLFWLVGFWCSGFLQKIQEDKQKI